MTFVAEDPEVPGVVRIGAASDFPRPHVAIFGAVHGDEPCGLRAIERLRAEAEAGSLPLERGTVVLVHGNPVATKAHCRHGHTGVDLNRLFDWAFVDELPRSMWRYEHHRALALRPVFEEVDALLDLHSATSDTEPFAIVNERTDADQLAARVGVRYVTYGWFGAGFLGHRTSLGVMSRRGRPGVVVECGRHDDPSSVVVAYEAATRFLRSLEVLSGTPPEPLEVTYAEMFGPIEKPSADFRFDRPIRGLDWMERGALLGHDSRQPVRVPEDCFVLLPNDTVAPGEDMIFLARPASPR